MEDWFHVGPTPPSGAVKHQLRRWEMGKTFERYVTGGDLEQTVFGLFRGWGPSEFNLILKKLRLKGKILSCMKQRWYRSVFREGERRRSQ